MKTYKTEDIRNIALIGGSGSGKTTLAESLLFESGAINRRGDIASGTTACDYMPVEKEYGYTVFSKLFTCIWQDHKLNFVDCAGSDDFIGGTISALDTCESCLAIVNAVYGLEVGLINRFRHIEAQHKPAFIAVNRLDDEKADFATALSQLKEYFGGKVVPLQYPVNPGAGFNAVIDLLNMKMLQWKEEGGTPEELEIPASEADKAEEMRQAMIESAAEHDDSLMEKFFENGTLTEDELIEGIRLGVTKGDMYPLFCISGLKKHGG